MYDDDIKVPWGKIALWFFLIVFVAGPVLGLIGSAMGFITLPFFKFGKKVEYTQKTIDMVYDAERCSAINAQYLKLKNAVPAVRDVQLPNAEKALTNFEKKLPEDQTTWSRVQQETESQLQTNVTGLQQQLSNLQIEYVTLSQREDAQPCLGSLPTFIDLK